jgi:hypothetical protein
MGRFSTGISTTNGSRKLDLRWMLRNNYFQKNRKVSGSMEWQDGSSSEFESLITDDEKYLRMIYTITDRKGIETHYDYKGDMLYFLCPESSKRARVLYMAYGHHKYIHRDWYLEHYGVRLYYNSQSSSKEDYHNTMYFNLKRQVEAIEEQIIGVKHRKIQYKGKATKLFQRLHHLKMKMEYHNRKRITILSQRLGVMKDKL